ncbi:hypothetical protein [Marinobacter sp. NFXS9]|uniref:hypothetical protein n=1 Tax=Marinobacter sp. NFXS9 TaxID=2818433 RepID=UPI0032DE56B2
MKGVQNSVEEDPKTRAMLLTIILTVLESFYIYVLLGTMNENNAVVVAVSFIAFALGTYNVLAFFLHLETITVGGREESQSDRYVGLAIGAAFVFASVMIPVSN